MIKKSYFNYLINPLGSLSTKKVLQVNPTVASNRKEADNIAIYLVEYNSESCVFKKLDNIEDSYKHLHTKEISWINIDGIKKSEVEKIASHFGIHPLIIEDIVSSGQRPKTDQINGLLFCVLNMLYFNEKESSVETEQISIVLGKDFVISFQEDATRDVFNVLREKIKISNSKVRQNGADFLFYTLLDSIVDHYYLVMENLAEKIEALEEDILKNSDSRTLIKINMLRKEMILLKRSIGPVRDLINGILKSENELIESKTEKYFKDVFDHIIQANDLAENYRDMMINLQDLYMSHVNLKQNEVMKVMAIVTCLLAPATVIGAVFGMNFEQIPMLHNKWGFGICVLLMVSIPIWMISFFKRRNWF